jgi:hypothetical protein
VPKLSVSLHFVTRHSRLLCKRFGDFEEKCVGTATKPFHAEDYIVADFAPELILVELAVYRPIGLGSYLLNDPANLHKTRHALGVV